MRFGLLGGGTLGVPAVASSDLRKGSVGATAPAGANRLRADDEVRTHEHVPGVLGQRGPTYGHPRESVPRALTFPRCGQLRSDLQAGPPIHSFVLFRVLFRESLFASNHLIRFSNRPSRDEGFATGPTAAVGL